MRAAVILALLFAALLALTNPTGSFPLNDDWSYGKAVKNLVEKGEYRLTNWTSMPLLTQVLWGALFSLPAGFSFTSLRLSTLVLSFLALLSLVLIARASAKSRPGLVLLGPLLLLFNPVYLDLSCTFMTDVPFLALTLASLSLLADGVDRRRNGATALGMLLALMATLIRQTGFLIPVAFGIGYLSSRRPTAKRILLAAGFVVFTAAALLAYGRWLAVTGRLPTAYNVQTTQTLAVLSSGLPVVAQRFAASLLVTFTYLGLFTLPLGLFFLNGASKKRLLPFLAVSAALLASAHLLKVGFPGNILSDRGVGPFTLAHSSDFAAFSGSTLSRVILALLALCGGALLFEMLTRFVRNARTSWVTTICLSFAALYFLSLSLVRQLDRYVLVYLPLLAIPAVIELRKTGIRKAAAVAGWSALLLYAVFSVSAVHDYMAWNRTRWQVLHYLMNGVSVPPDRIDGGFEFNGLYTYDEDYVRSPGRSPWWVKGDEYVVAFDVLPGYDTLRTYPVRHWLPAGVRRVYLLKRSAPDPRSG
jgi:hypothetical protein